MVRVSGFLFIKDFVTGPAETIGKNCSESFSKFMDLNEFIPIRHAPGNFHKSLSDTCMKQLMDLYLIRSLSWAPRLINLIPKIFSVSRNIHISQKYSSFVSQCTVNLKELVAFDILVTLYEWFGYNCVCLPHKSCRRTNLRNIVFSLCL